MTVSDLQKKLKTSIGEKATAPTEGGAEWNWYLELFNRAQRDWQSAYNWEELYKEVNTFNGSATLSLPADFRRLDGPVRISTTTTSTQEYLAIAPQERFQKVASAEYVYVLGDPKNGYSMIINPGSQSSSASIFYSYLANAATLASPADVSMCPNPEYLVERASYYYWRAKDDNRLEIAKQEADRILAEMLEREAEKGHGYDDRIKTYEEKRSSFRIGRN